jgi:hypothetical protein
MVFTGATSFVVPTPPQVGPAAFSMKITFQQPFFYHPSLGTLVLQINSTSEAPSDAVPIDFVSMSSGENFLFLFQNGNAVAAGTTPLEFGYTLVPEPKSLLILLAGLAILIWFYQKRSRHYGSD